MTDEQALKLAEKIKDAVHSFGASYHGGSYGNIHDKPGDPFCFKMNFTMGGEKFNIELTGNDFPLGPFVHNPEIMQETRQ